jgi:hypothetical protein
LPELELTAPERVALGLLPERLELEASPSSIQAGRDCGMPEMCGLDPCLCGIPDEYGACACNGTAATAPTLSVVSEDTGVVRAVRLGQDYWLVPWGSGSATLSVDAGLPHHGGATAEVEVDVAVPFAPWLLLAAALLAALAAVCLVLRRLARAQGGLARTGAAAIASGLLLCALLLVPLSACGPTATVAADSPRPTSASVASTGDGTEAGQRVEVRIGFDRPLEASGALAGDLALSLNGKPVDTEAVAVAASLEDDRTLLVVLSPAKGAGDTTSAHYFALYEGGLELSARDASGGLAHLAQPQGGANAVIGTPLRFQVPSGLVIETVEAVPGDVASGTAARAAFRIVDVPRIRAVSWIELEPGGERALVHNHEFAAYGDDAAGRGRYAAYLAGALGQAFDSGYVIEAADDTVTVTARTVTDGQALAPRVYEGVLE